MMFEVGKKYMTTYNGSIYECLSTLSDGQSLLRNIETDKHYLSSAPSLYREYKEPRKKTIYVIEYWDNIYCSTEPLHSKTNSKYVLLDTIEWVEKV